MSFAALNGGAVWALAAPVLVLLAGLLLLAVAHRRDADAAIGSLSRDARRRDRGRLGRGGAPVVHTGPTGREVEQAARLARRASAGAVATVEPSPPAAWAPPDDEALGLSRRQFFNRSIVGLMTLGMSGFGLAVLGFLWPSSSSAFGSKIRVGRLDDIRQKIAEGSGFAYYAEGRMRITEYRDEALAKARAVYDPPALPAIESGLTVTYQKCPHLGCRVPECVTSQWFECPCHGSQYTRVGERKGGPAPRGLDRFATEVSADTLSVDTGTILQGPPIGTDTTGQEAEGPHCVSGGE